MANEQHIAILRQGRDAWNLWRQKYPKLKPDLSGFDLTDFRLSGVNLSGADLSNSDLKRVDFAATNLIKPLTFERFERTSGYSTDLSEANLNHADLRKANLRLANLNGANLSAANLTEANLLMADLKDADLSHADLTRTQALITNFEAAILTGACIQEWNINSETILDDIVCAYIYRAQRQQERLPIDRNFASGEFTKLFQKTSSVVELIFNNGVDWISFAYSFGKLRIENEDAELVVENIENKGDGTVVIKVKVSQNADKTAIYYDFMQAYNLAQKVLKEQYDERLEEKDKHINQLFFLLQSSQEKLGEVPKLMINNPTRITNVHHGNYIESNTGTYIQGDYIRMSPDLAQTATQIQDLIEQLQKYGMTVDVAQEQVAKDMATQAQTNPTVKDKLLKWGQSLGDATVSDVVKGAVKLAIRSAGIPLP